MAITARWCTCRGPRRMPLHGCWGLVSWLVAVQVSPEAVPGACTENAGGRGATLLKDKQIQSEHEVIKQLPVVRFGRRAGF
jgi:hypothetical protein